MSRAPTSFRPLRRWAGLLAGLIAGGLLAACSGGNIDQRAELQIVQTFRSNIQKKIKDRNKPARPPLTRAALDTVKVSAIEVTLERRDIFAYLFIDGERGDDSPGRITVWRTEDDVSIATRNGVVIATRGLGGDILSSTVQVSGDSPGPSSGGERVLMIRGLDNTEQRLSLSCDLEDLGPDPIEIVELVHPTRHLRETCDGAGGQIVNDYWADARAGLVWQSRQWAGPQIGYMRLRRLTN